MPTAPGLQVLYLNLDKLLLVLLLIGMATLILHFSHDKADSAMIEWAKGVFSTAFGALVGLITGRGFKPKNGNGTSGRGPNGTGNGGTK